MVCDHQQNRPPNDRLSVQSTQVLHVDARTQSFVVNSLRLKAKFTLTVDQTAPPITVNSQQVLYR